MGNGLNRRKAASLASLFLFPLLAACDVSVGTRVAWSPSGRAVAFLSNGRPWVYDFASGSLTKVVAPVATADQVAWSSQESLLAISTRNVVELVSEDQGRYAASAVFTAPELDGATDFVLSWHPKEKRLLLVQSGDKISTSEIVASSETIDTSPGYGVYGPGGSWILWVNQAAVGHQQDRMVFVREGLDHGVLPLSDEDQAILGDSGSAMMWPWGNPPCVTQKHDEGTKLYCFDEAGRLRMKAALPKETETPGNGKEVDTGAVFINRAQTLFTRDSFEIVDAKGKIKTHGKHFMDAVSREIPEAAASTSNIAWSPDGNWLAIVINGRLCLWNWRNDVARILPKLD
jgi:WD40 repeat protein